MTPLNPSCKFCEKQGLPILPVRLGVAPRQAFDVYRFQTPPPDATQLLGNPEVTLEAPDTLYTGRMVRAGFLYVYYESHKQWEAYAIDDAGCLSWMPLTDGVPTAGDRFHTACARDATKVANASVLTIQDPETAGIVWIGFSDAWWTKTIRDNNAGLASSERAVFMRKVDVAGWYNGGNPGGKRPEHAFQVYQVDMAVAEYTMPIVDGALAFAWAGPGGFPDFTARSADTLKQECDALVEGKGLVLALQDPVGIARELPLYMQARWADFSAPYARQLKVDADLTQLKQIIERQAQDDLVKKFDFQQNGVESLGDWALKSVGNAVVHELRDVFGGADSHPDVAVPNALTDASVQKYCADTWKPYAAVINHAKRAAFKQEFASASQGYNSKMMVPLAKAHVGWLQSQTLHACFDHHYDPDDINTGVGFSTVFTACVIGTAGYGESQKLYRGWLREGAQASVSAMNLMWRALLCNNPTLAAKVKTVHAGVTGDSGPGANDGWQSLFAAFELVSSKLHFAGEQASKRVTLQSNVGTLTAELGGTMVSIIQQRDPAANDLLATLGMHAGSPAKVVTVYGTLGDLYRSVFDTLDALQPHVSQKVKAAKMFALSDRLRIFEAELSAKHINPYTEKVRSWRVLFDDSAIDHDALSHMAPEQQADAMAGRLKAVGAVHEDGLVPIDNYASRTIKALKLPGAAAAFVLVFAAAGWHNALGDMHTALDGTQTQAEFMVASAVTGTIGAGFDVVRTGIAQALEHPSGYLGPIANVVGPEWLTFAKAGGAAGGAVAMWIAAAADLTDVVASLEQAKPGLAVLHFARFGTEGAVGAQLGLDLLAACGWEVGIVILSDPAMWVAAIAIIAVSAVIALVEDPKSMQWAEACYFGMQPNTNYNADEALEQSDYVAALAG